MQKLNLKCLSIGAFASVFAAGIALALCLAFPSTALGQGIVSANMTGTLVDSAGKPLAGAAVKAVHTSTNTTYTDVTGDSGRFAFTGMRVGGPYTVTAEVSGYQVQALENVQTTLGEDTTLVLVAKEEVVAMDKFVASVSHVGLDANATGASSVLSRTRIDLMPTASYSFADLSKTNPFTSIRAGQQVQALGMNNRFNTITLDGAKINDSFGLNSSGLFSLNNPFSLDAVEQYSISLTPYDVRQSGFAGANINAVSKSGTNELHGSGYFLFDDQNWQGRDIAGATAGGPRTLWKERTYGFTVGGPILKNRLFFFTNFEKYYRDYAGATRPGFYPDSGFLTAVNARLSQLPGSPTMGTFGASSTSRLSDSKRMGKIDWNISANHRLSVRYSDTIGVQPNFGSYNATSFSQPASSSGLPSSGFNNATTSLSSNFYTLDIKEHVWAAQLFDNWSPDFKTQFNYSNTKQDSVRTVPVKFPEVRILNVPGLTSNGATIPDSSNVYSDAFRFGSEISSMGNELHIKTQTLGGSGDYNWKAFTFTIGADHEKTDFYNLYRQGSYGVFSYNNLAAFQADTPTGFMRAVIQTGLPVADISQLEQTGVFGQVKWAPTSRFTAILGFRDDFIGSPIAPPENVTFKNTFGLTNAGTVDGTTNPAPRVSFNYALDGQRVTQIRGGTGIFLGRNPWVWISNSYGNFGVSRFTAITTTAPIPTLTQYLNGSFSDSDPAYKFDPNNPIGTTDKTAAANLAQTINLIKPGMRLPTIQRSNLAIDRKVPFLGATVSVEYIQTNQLDALFVDNMNLRPTTLGADGRQRFAGSPSSFPLYTGFANVIRTRNVHAGVSKYLSFSLDHPVNNGWAYTVSYTHGQATEAQSLNSSTANSQWTYNSVFNQNQVETSRSDYEIRDRVQATVSREFRLRKDLVTTVALYYEGRTGQPYSWVYSNDLNGDGNSANDVMAVPTGPTDPRFDFSGMTPAQQTAYFNYINHDRALVRYAGSYVPRNAATAPWQNRLDLKFVQELPAYKRCKLQLHLDFINFGSWIARGVFNYIQEINTSTTNGNQVRALGSATYTAAGLIKPVISTDQANQIALGSSYLIQSNNGDSRWKIVGGVHLLF